MFIELYLGLLTKPNSKIITREYHKLLFPGYIPHIVIYSNVAK